MEASVEFQTKPVLSAHSTWVDIGMEFRGIDCCDGSGLAILENEIDNTEIGKGRLKKK